MEDFTKQPTLESENAMQGKYLTFFLGEETYGIDIEYVTEIITYEPVRSVPDVANYMKGIINLRGKVIPVIDVRIKFNKEEKEYDDMTCIIVVDIDGQPAGFIVDSVDEVAYIDENDISTPPLVQKLGNEYLKGVGRVGDKIKLLLDCRLMVDQEAS